MKSVVRRLLSTLGYDLHRLAVSSVSQSRASEAEQLLREIPTVPLFDLLGGQKVEIRLMIQAYEDGILPMQDAIALLSIMAKERPALVLEIGTFMGHTTKAMAENMPTATIHTVDLPTDFSAEKDVQQNLPKDDFHLIKRRIVGREFKDTPVGQRIVQHFGDTAEFDFRTVGRPSFFFIDGSHTYEYCKNDSERCLAIAPKRSTFLWHDCDVDHPGVGRLVSEWRRAGRNVVRIDCTALAYWRNV